MIKSKLGIVTFIFNLILSTAVFIDASRNLFRQKSRSDDEDSVTGSVRNFQSSGDGPDVYPNLDPYTRTRSTATILVDVAFVHPYKSYMLPGSPGTNQLQSFYNKIIENFQIELHTIYVKLDFKILSLRPGPLAPKRNPIRSDDGSVPTVFVRMNITQHNSSIVNPLIIFRISQCGRIGKLGNLTIAEQIIFPQYVCTNQEVYCLPKCGTGAYCDGIVDCPETKLDEPKSCPKCLYKHVQLTPNNRLLLDEEDNLQLDCNFSSKCQNLKEKIRWKFPLQLKRYEEHYKSVANINSLPKNLITSGIYRCTIDGESSSVNVTIFKKPKVEVTKADSDAETVIISEIEGSKVDYWCNTTDGLAEWLPALTNGVEIRNVNNNCSKITFNEITKAMATSYQCRVKWGHLKDKVIRKTITVIVLCDVTKHFECKNISSKRSCIPLSQKCDSISQCHDGSDEADCNFCKENELSIDANKRVEKDIGDTIIITCSSTKELCKPTSWWSRGQAIGPAGNIFAFMESLFIVQARSEYTGLYQCYDKSIRTSVNVFVQINSGPTVHLSAQRNVFNISVGQSGSIDCFLIHPVNVTYQKNKPRWAKVNQNYFPTNVEVISVDNTRTRIMFKKAQLSMSGIYECETTWGTTSRKVVREGVTVNITPLICLSGEKMCVDNTMCLPESLWCDGAVQCSDGSDEKQCDKCTNGFVFVEPREITVLVGQTVELVCYYDKDCYPVKWKISSDRTALSTVNGLEVHDNKLIINNVGLDATNTYECYSGVKRFGSNVTVIRQVELNLSAPYAIVAYKDNIDVNCQSNYGRPQWRRRDSKPLSSIAAVKVTNPANNVAKLYFTSPSYDSNGYYVCFVRLSPKEEEVASMLMYVYVKGLICTPDQIMCDRNTKCVSKSKICDSVKDCKDGEDEKMCSKCKSNLEVTPKTLTVTTLGYGVIKCVIPNAECLPIKWKFKNQTSSKNSRFHPFEDSLYIINPRLSDSDEIMCTSGLKSASAFLTVKELTLKIEPNTSEESPIFILKGQSRKVSCKSNIGTPRWVFPEESFVANFGGRFLQTEDNVAVLEFANVQKEASMDYLCEVEFSRETKRKNISIKVI